MLSSVPLPNYNSATLYKSMFETADDADLNNLKKFEVQIVAAYGNYDHQHGNSQHLKPVTGVNEKLKEAIDRCYGRLGNKKISPSYVRDLLLDAVPVCPYCGVGETAELDHVLPRSVWPEFTIHISNLVPACRKCNGNKSDRSFLTSGWSYHHPYFHSELSTKFLFAMPIISGPNIRYEFTVRRPPQVSQATFHSVEEAFRTFHLAKRFASQSVHRLSNRSLKLRQLFGALGSAGVKDYLLGEATSISDARGVNYWEAVLLSDLSSSTEYCEFEHWS